MKSKYILPLFFVFQIVFLKIIAFFPELVEQYYSNGFYQNISVFSRVFFGNIPFSIGDCLYGLLIIFIIKWFWKVRNTWREMYKTNLLSIVSFLSVFYFIFHFLWALNYYREPLFEKMKINREYSDQDLYVFTNKLIDKTNQIQFEITNDKQSKVVFPISQDQAFVMNLNGYKKLAEQYPFFEYKHLSVKKSLFSLPLTYMGFGGYLNPFTNEAQVNYMMPTYNFPMTSNHEMAHQMGFASESECNFVGFLACVKNDNLNFRYAGYVTALKYCLNNWEVRNPEIYNQLIKKVNPGILENYKESAVFWKKYETPVETAFKIFYDNFLKLNQQKDGLESYSKFVDLMVNYYKIHPI